ncbi:sodium:solute symporter [candidate division KSB1 bacterium]|nr:sodium:solute symporter [candidate division KSB1 bacterium]RQW05410.1 MAG: sodium:solute symporter [candidate division KSB1 bacterium]
MSANLAITVVVAYFFLLWIISMFTTRHTSENTFFTADKKSNWILVAFGMVGVALSGLTFISVPGEVGNSQFTYFQLVMGFSAGIFIIATVLLPLYYRLKLVSIYRYVEQRFGFWSYKTAAALFLLSQTMTAAFKLFLMTTVLQVAFFDAYSIPFQVSALVTLLLIWLYTYRGGIKTIVVTDTLQTALLIMAAIATILIISGELNLTFGALLSSVTASPLSKTFVWNWTSDRNFFKLFFTGMFLTIITNGLDQSIMQKHLTCPTLKDAKKNMFWFGSALLFVNMIFLILGLLLYMFAAEKGIAIPKQTDELYPLLALNHLHLFTGIVFLLGIAAAAYSSADSALAGLTTSFCVDFLGYTKEGKTISTRKRTLVHLCFSLLIFVVITIFHALNNDSLINSFIRVSGYTYGPLLGLFIFGMFTRKNVKDKWVPLIAVLAPTICVLLYFYSEALLNGYKFGFEILLVNGCLTILGLMLISRRENSE